MGTVFVRDEVPEGMEAVGTWTIEDHRRFRLRWRLNDVLSAVTKCKDTLEGVNSNISLIDAQIADAQVWIITFFLVQLI